MSSGEGRQSPPPETQTGAQMKDAPGSGKGLANKEEDAKDNIHDAKAQLSALSSNPKGPLDDVVTEKFKKTEK